MRINTVEKITAGDYIFYKVTYTSGVISQVPYNVPDNSDYKDILKWVEQGNTITETTLTPE